MKSSQRKRKPKNLSKKQKFIKDGVFYAELNDLLAKELAEQGYAGCDVRVTPKKTEIIIHANKTMKVVGDDGRRARELTKLIEKRFMFEEGSIKIFAQRIKNRGLSALSQAEAVRFRLFEGLSVRRACYSVLKWIMDRGAKGCEVVVSGKLRGQRAKSMKFREGYMIHAGDATNYYIDTAIKHVHLRQGVLGIKVKIMLPHKNDESKGGRDGGQNQGVEKQLPDTVKIRDPKDVDPDRMIHETNKMNRQRGIPTFNNNFNNQQQQQNNFNNQQQGQNNNMQQDNQQTQQFDPNQQQFQQQQQQQQDIQGQMDPNLLQQQQQQQQQMDQQQNFGQQQNYGQQQNQNYGQQQQQNYGQQQQFDNQGGFQQYQ